MMKEILNAWLLQFDWEMIKQKSKVLLFSDSCSSHMKPPQLEAVQVAYFPPNATTVLQPIDQGVVHSGKAAYRTRLVEHLLFDMQNDWELKIDVIFPVEVLASFWQQVKGEVIKNCFRKAGFQQNDGSAEEESSVPDDETSPEDKPSDPSVWPQVMEAFGADSFSDFVTFDNGVIDNEQLSDKKVRTTIEGRS